MNIESFDTPGDRDAATASLSRDALMAEYVRLRAENDALASRIGELEEEICRDVLTPVFNRRHFRVELGKKLLQCRRYGSKGALVFIDVDNLKQINDRYGHIAGDEALMTIARILLANVRGSDLVARIGGDEFALILDAIGEDQIEAKIASLAEKLAGARPAFADADFTLSATFGYAFLNANDEIDEVIMRADRAMYILKQADRPASDASATERPANRRAAPKA